MADGVDGRNRRDIEVQRYAGDLDQAMVEEVGQAVTAEVARHWLAVYDQLLELEEDVLERIKHLIPRLGPEAKAEAERTNIPVIQAAVHRFRHRRELWRQRLAELNSQ